MAADAISYQTWRKLIQAHKADAELRAPTIHKWISWYHSRTVGLADPGTRAAQAHSPDAVPKLSVHNNYVYSYMDQMVANICPQNPQVTIDTAFPDAEQACKARQHLINHTFRADRLHKVLHRATLWASLAGASFVKVVWDVRRKRPSAKVLHPLRVWYDYTEDFEDSRYVIEVVTLTEQQANEMVASGVYDAEMVKRLDYAQYPTWLYDDQGDRAAARVAARDANKWTTIYEVYDRELREVYHISLDIEDQPLNHDKVGHPYKFAEPYHACVFNQDFETSLGVSDVQLIADALDRLNEIDTLELEHAHVSIPSMVFMENLVENATQTKKAIADGTSPGAVIGIKGKGTYTIDQIIQWTQTPAMSPAFAEMRARLVQLIEAVLGIPQYMRGGHSGGEVATEFALIDTAAQTRNGRRRDVLDDLVEDIGQAMMDLWEDKMATDRPVMAMIDRTTRGTVITRDDILPREDLSDEQKFVYQALVHSPTENNRLVQLQQVNAYAPYIFQNPAFDQWKVANKLATLLHMEDCMTSQKQFQQSQAPVEGAEDSGGGAPPGTPVVSGSPDTLLTGAVPGGLDDTIMPAATSALADQPKVEV